MLRAEACINKETLNHICLQTGVSADFLSKKTDLTVGKINSWLDTTSDELPTFNQAKKIAKALKIPFAGLYMSKNNIPIMKLPLLRNFRTLPNQTAIDDSSLNLAVAELIRYKKFLSNSEEEMNIESAPLLLPVLSKNADILKFSQTIREFFNLKVDEQFKLSSARQFYLYVRRKIESKGIFIQCFTGIDVEIVRGISIYNDASPIIGINDNDRYPAKTFSIIHELVHILKRETALCNEMVSSFSDKNEEIFCNAIAGEVLVPKDSLDATLKAKNITIISLNEIESIAKQYSVSKEVITRRLLDINRLIKDEYIALANEIRQNFLNERDAEKNARKEGRKPRIFKNVIRAAIDKTSPAICKILSTGYGDEYFSKQDISGYLGIKERHIQKFLAEVAKW